MPDDSPEKDWVTAQDSFRSNDVPILASWLASWALCMAHEKDEIVLSNGPNAFKITDSHMQYHQKLVEILEIQRGASEKYNDIIVGNGVHCVPKAHCRPSFSQQTPWVVAYLKKMGDKETNMYEKKVDIQSKDGHCITIKQLYERVRKVFGITNPTFVLSQTDKSNGRTLRLPFNSNDLLTDHNIKHVSTKYSKLAAEFVEVMDKIMREEASDFSEDALNADIGKVLRLIDDLKERIVSVCKTIMEKRTTHDKEAELKKMREDQGNYLAKLETIKQKLEALKQFKWLPERQYHFQKECAKAKSVVVNKIRSNFGDMSTKLNIIFEKPFNSYLVVQSQEYGQRTLVLDVSTTKMFQLMKMIRDSYHFEEDKKIKFQFVNSRNLKL